MCIFSLKRNIFMRYRKYWPGCHFSLSVISSFDNTSSYFALMLFGSFALHPDWGMTTTKGNATLRLIHKWSGRFTMALAWACVFTGCTTLKHDWYDFYLYIRTTLSHYLITNSNKRAAFRIISILYYFLVSKWFLVSHLKPAQVKSYCFSSCIRWNR